MMESAGSKNDAEQVATEPNAEDAPNAPKVSGSGNDNTKESNASTTTTTTTVNDASAPTQESSDSTTTTSNSNTNSNTTTTTTTNSPVWFPCLEQPLRVVLHGTSGHYLWAGRKGQVIARTRRSEKDEWRIANLSQQQHEGLVQIYNHKFGGLLTVVPQPQQDGTIKHMVVCIKPNKKKNDDDNHTTQQEVETPAAAEQQHDDKDDDDEEEDDATALNATKVDTADVDPKAQQWCFIQSAQQGNRVMLQSLQTGEFLAIDPKGQVVLTHDMSLDGSQNHHSVDGASTTTTTITTTWHVECVTGELCFLSNVAFQSQVRCDMAGLTSLTDQWKGWEVFRIMESSHHYVKISSWMHRQWILCSTADGTVTTCTLSQAMTLDYQQDDDDDDQSSNEEAHGGKTCSKWAIERHPDGNGVMIRSQRHGRLLSIQDGALRTYSEHDIPQALGTQLAASTTAPKRQSWADVKQSMTGGMRNMQQKWSSVRSSMASSSSSSTTISSHKNGPSIAQKDTTVWQLEAAHLQTYYFGSIVVGENPMTIGPFPKVTTNLRKTDQLRLVQRWNHPDDASTTITKLYHVEKEQYVACTSSEGTITLVVRSDDTAENDNDESCCTDWIMEKQPGVQDDGGSIFRSTKYHLYLSYQEDSPTAPDDKAAAEETTSSTNKHLQQFSAMFRNQPDKVGTLVGTTHVHVWRLEPCMPRAVSSEKIATFAIGTSIAVGTTIAMPFALAGVAGVMGLVGLEAGIAFNVIAAGLTGAEFLASVGAIGATAYLVFRPAENSLTDEQGKDEEEGEREWSKRPFSNWRNW